MGEVRTIIDGQLANAQTSIYRVSDGEYLLSPALELFCTGAGPEVVQLWILSDLYPTARMVAQMTLSSAVPQAYVDFAPGFGPTDTIQGKTTTAATVNYALRAARQFPGEI